MFAALSVSLMQIQMHPCMCWILNKPNCTKKVIIDLDLSCLVLWRKLLADYQQNLGNNPMVKSLFLHALAFFTLGAVCSGIASPFLEVGTYSQPPHFMGSTGLFHRSNWALGAVGFFRFETSSIWVARRRVCMIEIERQFSCQCLIWQHPCSLNCGCASWMPKLA